MQSRAEQASCTPQSGISRCQSDGAQGTGAAQPRGSLGRSQGQAAMHGPGSQHGPGKKGELLWLLLLLLRLQPATLQVNAPPTSCSAGTRRRTQHQPHSQLQTHCPNQLPARVSISCVVLLDAGSRADMGRGIYVYHSANIQPEADGDPAPGQGHAPAQIQWAARLLPCTCRGSPAVFCIAAAGAGSREGSAAMAQGRACTQ